MSNASAVSPHAACEGQHRTGAVALEHGRVHDGVAPVTLPSPLRGRGMKRHAEIWARLGRFVPSPPGRVILPPSAARGRLA